MPDLSHNLVRTDLGRISLTLLCVSFACVIDENPSHHLCGDAEELSPVLPVYRLRIDESEISLMHERCCLQRVPASLAIQILLGESTQFVVDDRHQFVECRFITHGNYGATKRHKKHKTVNTLTVLCLLCLFAANFFCAFLWRFFEPFQTAFGR